MHILGAAWQSWTHEHVQMKDAAVEIGNIKAHSLKHIPCLEVVILLSAEPGTTETSSIKIKETTGMWAVGYKRVSGL